MTATALLDDLESAGVRLTLAGDDLRYQTRPGVSIAPYRDLVAESKLALVAELRLRRQIITEATADPADFNRAAYDALWVQWHADRKATW
jgi:hypothetical protein